MTEKAATRQPAEARGIRGTISVSEIFGPTVQGEGAVIGKPTVFVRTGGCDYRCSWCDSKFAVLPEFRHTWSRMSPEEIFSEVRRLSPHPILVTLSGGNPALQPFGDLIRLGKAKGYGFTIETQGTLARDWFVELDYLTLSPKPPSSGMETDWEKLARCVEASGSETETIMKVVVFDDRDYAYAKEVGSPLSGGSHVSSGRQRRSPRSGSHRQDGARHRQAPETIRVAHREGSRRWVERCHRAAAASRASLGQQAWGLSFGF